MTSRERLDAYEAKWAAIQEYWRNPQPFDEERARRLAIFNAAMAPHDARVRAEQEMRWEREERA